VLALHHPQVREDVAHVTVMTLPCSTWISLNEDFTHKGWFQLRALQLHLLCLTEIPILLIGHIATCSGGNYKKH